MDTLFQNTLFDEGLVIMVVGMGGTLVSLGFIILLVSVMKRLLPYKEERTEGKSA